MSSELPRLPIKIDRWPRTFYFQKKKAPLDIGVRLFSLERDTGIEPVPPAWKASVLPLYESRKWL